jgi:hypothetical protein
MHETPAYGLWSLVVINSAVFIVFAPTEVAHIGRVQPYRGRSC